MPHYNMLFCEREPYSTLRNVCEWEGIIFHIMMFASKRESNSTYDMFVSGRE